MRASLALGVGFAGLLAAWPIAAFAPEAKPAARRPAAAPRTAVWIEVDAGCTARGLHDVDDCIALVQALRSPELEVRGISATYGNVDRVEAAKAARRVLELVGGARPVALGAAAPLGASGAGCTAPSDAERSLARALERERLTIVALGPLTTVASLLRHRPDLASRIERVVAVAGRREGRRLRPNRWLPFAFADLNFERDPDAFARVIEAGVPLVLAPFELGRQVTLGGGDLAHLRHGSAASRWLGDRSRRWLAAWQLGLWQAGFSPFDALAVGLVVEPHAFDCRAADVRIVDGEGAPRLEARPARDRHASRIRYCGRVDSAFKQRLMRRLTEADA